jgi:choline dehydrogenase-like flavoprotein
MTATPQKGLGDRVVPYPQGKALGGSSSIDFSVWARGSRDDYNRWANLTADDRWSWDSMLPYFKKVSMTIAYHIEFVLIRRSPV